MATVNRSEQPDPRHRSPEQLEDDIAETRRRISQNVDDLAYKLSPAGIGHEVKGTLADTQQLTFGAIEGLGDEFVTRTGNWGEKTRGFAKRHSVPVTLVGLGLAWLVMRSSRR